MATAMGILKWTPKTFWSSGVYEYTAAMKGHLVSNGADLTPPPSREEIRQAFADFDKKAMKAAKRGV